MAKVVSYLKALVPRLGKIKPAYLKYLIYLFGHMHFYRFPGKNLFGPRGELNQKKEGKPDECF